MDIIELNAQNIERGFGDVTNARRECAVYGIPDACYVYRGDKTDINMDYIQKNNIKVFYINNAGGVIVISKGDFDIGIFKQNGYNIIEEISKKSIEVLKEKIPNAKLMGNDFVIEEDGVIYKVGSSSSINICDGYIYTAVHFSININMELINNICTKDMHKIPKALSDYGVTTEYIKEKMLEILKNM